MMNNQKNMICHEIISDDCIDAIYDVNLIASRKVNSKCKDSFTKTAEITILDTNNRGMTQIVIKREYHSAKLLYGKENEFGKVAEHKTFILHKEFRKKGIAREITANEEKIYGEKSFDQVQLEAEWDGVVVWRKLGYEYVDETAEDEIVAAWNMFINKFIVQTGKMDVESRAKLIAGIESVDSIPVEYTVGEDGKEFTDWYENGYPDKQLFLIEMYKEIP